METGKKIGYGGRWIAAGLAPSALAGELWAVQGVRGIAIPVRLLSALLALGGIVLLGLGVLLVIELSQDRRLNAYHLRSRRTKLPLGSGTFECQACGSRQLGEKDVVCRACGVVFEDEVGKERRRGPICIAPSLAPARW